MSERDSDDAGVVHEVVDLATPFQTVRDHALDVVGICDVYADRTGRIRRQLGQFAHGLLQQIAVDVGDEHAGALPDEGLGDASAKPASGAGHDHGLLFEPLAHLP